MPWDNKLEGCRYVYFKFYNVLLFDKYRNSFDDSNKYFIVIQLIVPALQPSVVIYFYQLISILVIIAISRDKIVKIIMIKLITYDKYLDSVSLKKIIYKNVGE